MESTKICCYEFGEFKLDGRRRSLTKNGDKVPLPARNFDLLLFMVENGGRILEHDELLDKVWAGTFVEQATLKKGISALRQILVEKPENEFIKTIPRRGYSFVSPVRVIPENEELYFVRETEKEIIVEEYEEIDEAADRKQPETIIEAPTTSVQTLPAAESKNKTLTRSAVYGGLAIATLVLILFGLKPYFSRTVQPQFSVENVRINRITNTGKIIDTAISPDGAYLLYPSADKDGVSLWLRQIATNTTKRLTAPARGGFWGLDFAPDNSYIYYIFKSASETEKSVLYKIPMLGAEPKKIYEDISSVIASPDGKKIAFIHLSDKVDVFTANTDGEDVKQIGSFPLGFSLAGISWTPDGTSVLMTLRKKLEDKALYYISELSADNGRETVILPPQEKIIYGGTWLPDKSSIIVTMREPNADIRQIWQYFPDNQEWRRVTNDDNSYKYVSLTRDGKTIVSKQESRLAAIWVTDSLSLDKNNQDKKSLLDSSDSFRQITEGMNNFDRLGWLSENQIMYSSTEESREIIFITNSTGANSQRISTGEDGIWLAPTVSGNKQSVCFLTSQKGLKQIARVDADGKNLKQLTQSDTTIYIGHILRDNSTVLYTTPKPGGVFLFKQTADGQITQLTETNTGLFAVSADDKFLAVEVTDKNTGKLAIELRSLENNSHIKTFNIVSGRELRFTPDGKFIAYDAPLGEFNQIMLQPIESGEPFSLTSFQSDFIWSYDWSPNGKHLAVIRGKQLSDAVLIKTTK